MFRDSRSCRALPHPCRLPTGLEDVSKYPDLVAELLRRNWTELEVKGVLAENLLRVFKEVEQVRRSHPHPTPACWALPHPVHPHPGKQPHTHP